jgi:hypothetical protein
MTITPVKWSIHDYHHMNTTGLLEGRPVELLNREIIKMSPEGQMACPDRDPCAMRSHVFFQYSN